ncbi:MAG: hypothetical protein CL910_19165 [Deltaproteobacteria bacterium]|jgi:hypothetical protein|nr:hypothetical protein [Deltaproteobacteria bacterium]
MSKQWRRTGLSSLILIMLSMPSAALAAAGPKILVTLRAPTGPSLADADSHTQTLLDFNATIPYGTIGSAVRAAAKAKADQYGDHEGDVSWSHIDYHYETNATAGFGFTPSPARIRWARHQGSTHERGTRHPGPHAPSQ